MRLIKVHTGGKGGKAKVTTGVLISVACSLLLGCAVTRETTEYSADGRTPRALSRETFPFGYGTDRAGHIYPSDNLIAAGRDVCLELVKLSPELAAKIASDGLATAKQTAPKP